MIEFIVMSWSNLTVVEAIILEIRTDDVLRFGVPTLDPVNCETFTVTCEEIEPDYAHVM